MKRILAVAAAAALAITPLALTSRAQVSTPHTDHATAEPAHIVSRSGKQPLEVNASSRSSAAASALAKKILDFHGRRMTIPTSKSKALRSIKNLAYSTNWSGLATTGSGIEGVVGEWTVPTIQDSSTALFSASWVGVDGDGNSDLIQVGTSQDTTDGYFAWWEILPAASVPIGYVYPGDQIAALIQEEDPGVWGIAIDDVTQDSDFAVTVSYNGPDASAEWIEEAPTVNGQQTTPADFGSVQFQYLGVYGDFGSEGTTWYYPSLNASNEIAMVNPSYTRIYALPTAPTVSGNDESFTDNYVDTPLYPSVPRDVTASAGVESAHVSWLPPTNDAGQPIWYYEVAVYRNGVYERYLLPSGTSVNITGLTAGADYTFYVAARNEAGQWSNWSTSSNSVVPKSPETAPSAPRGVTASAGVKSARVSWAPPASNGGSPIEDYVVRMYRNGVYQRAITTTLTSVSIAELTAGARYTFWVDAENAVGASAAVGSDAVVPFSTPSAPRSLAGKAGAHSVHLTWSAPANNGGRSISHYTVREYKAGVLKAVVTVYGTSRTFTGLTVKAAYTYTVTATNGAGLTSAVARTGTIRPKS